MEQLDIQEIVREITPFYNSYKQSSRSISGVEALYIMWDIGDILKKKIEISSIAPHALYRKIYGKAEGNKNITQKSYITREFLGRAYRIRNIFKNKKDISKELPNLKNFILFREAMPFFDNDKYQVKGDERKNLLALLNSDLNASLILKKVKALQGEKIGKKNPRNQRLGDVEPQKQIFIDFYNYLFKLIKNNDYSFVKKEIAPFEGALLSLSSNTSTLAQEGFLFTEIPELALDTQWGIYAKMLNQFSKQIDAKKRRRFRRVVSPERIVRLAEMIQALTSEVSFRNFKR